MATKTQAKKSVDVGALFADASGQFRGLNMQEPGQWPPLPKLMVWLLVAAAIVLIAWLLLLTDATDALEAERAKEPALKADYRAKLAQAVNLGELLKQKQQVEEYVTQLEKQLPGKAEMDALLSDINQAGIGRGLNFDLFRPGQVAVKDYYAELPISIRVTGRYHDVGAFAADIANLSRIVTLHDLSIAPAAVAPGTREPVLGMDAVARTYRYLDETELAAQNKAKAGAKK